MAHTYYVLLLSTYSYHYLCHYSYYNIRYKLYTDVKKLFSKKNCYFFLSYFSCFNFSEKSVDHFQIKFWLKLDGLIGELEVKTVFFLNVALLN